MTETKVGRTQPCLPAYPWVWEGHAATATYKWCFFKLGVFVDKLKNELGLS